MTEVTDIRAGMDRLEHTFVDLARTVDAADLDQRRRLIALRRALSDDFGRLDRTVTAAGASHRLATSEVDEFRRRFGELRRAVALHQAQWPTVLMADDMAGYVAAAQAVRRKRDAFMGWMRRDFIAGVARR